MIALTYNMNSATTVVGFTFVKHFEPGQNLPNWTDLWCKSRLCSSR